MEKNIENGSSYAAILEDLNLEIAAAARAALEDCSQKLLEKVDETLGETAVDEALTSYRAALMASFPFLREEVLSPHLEQMDKKININIRKRKIGLRIQKIRQAIFEILTSFCSSFALKLSPEYIFLRPTMVSQRELSEIEKGNFSLRDLKAPDSLISRIIRIWSLNEAAISSGEGDFFDENSGDLARAFLLNINSAIEFQNRKNRGEHSPIIKSADSEKGKSSLEAILSSQQLNFNEDKEKNEEPVLAAAIPPQETASVVSVEKSAEASSSKNRRKRPKKNVEILLPPSWAPISKETIDRFLQINQKKRPSAIGVAFSEFLERRNERNYNQAAQALDITSTIFYQIRDGLKPVSRDLFALACNYYQPDPQEIFGPNWLEILQSVNSGFPYAANGEQRMETQAYIEKTCPCWLEEIPKDEKTPLPMALLAERELVSGLFPTFSVLGGYPEIIVRRRLEEMQKTDEDKQKLRRRLVCLAMLESGYKSKREVGVAAGRQHDFFSQNKDLTLTMTTISHLVKEGSSMIKYLLNGFNELGMPLEEIEPRLNEIQENKTPHPEFNRQFIRILLTKTAQDYDALADSLDVDKKTIHNIEQCRTTISLSVFLKACSTFGVSAQEFFNL